MVCSCSSIFSLVVTGEPPHASPMALASKTHMCIFPFLFWLGHHEGAVSTRSAPWLAYLPEQDSTAQPLGLSLLRISLYGALPAPRDPLDKLPRGSALGSYPFEAPNDAGSLVTKKLRRPESVGTSCDERIRPFTMACD